MRIVPVSEALNLEVGEKIPVLRGLIGRIYDRSTGTNEFGPWAIQKIEVADEKALTKKIMVKLFDCDEIFAKQKNTVIVIESGQGTKGMTGVEVVEDTYKKEEGEPIKKMIQVRGIKADKPGATITVGGQAPAAPAQTQTAAANPATDKPAPAPQGQTKPGQTPAPTEHKPHVIVPNGQRVGMAINNAVHLSARRPDLVPGSREFNQWLYEQSSDLIRLSGMLEEGKLAPSSKERAAAAAKEADKSKPAGQ